MLRLLNTNYRITSSSFPFINQNFNLRKSSSSNKINTSKNLTILHDLEKKFANNHHVIPSTFEYIDSNTLADKKSSMTNEATLYFEPMSSISVVQNSPATRSIINKLELDKLKITTYGDVEVKDLKARKFDASCRNLLIDGYILGDIDVRGIASLKATRIQGKTIAITGFIEDITIGSIYADDVKISQSDSETGEASGLYSSMNFSNIQGNCLIESTQPVNINIRSFTGDSLNIFNRIGDLSIYFSGVPLPRLVDIKVAEGNIKIFLPEIEEMKKSIGSTIHLRGKMVKIDEKLAEKISEVPYPDFKEVEVIYGNETSNDSTLWTISTLRGDIDVICSSWAKSFEFSKSQL